MIKFSKYLFFKRTYILAICLYHFILIYSKHLYTINIFKTFRLMLTLLNYIAYIPKKYSHFTPFYFITTVIIDSKDNNN